MPGTVLSFYKKKHAEYSDKLRKIKKRQRIFVFLRLALFSLMVFLPMVFISEHLLIAILVFVFLLILFILLVRSFIYLEKQSNYLSCLIGINLHEIEAIRGNLGSFADGSEYVDPDHHYSFDLDIFGPDSVFQHINRTVTANGKESLAEMLLKPAGDPLAIGRRQDAFSELSGKNDFCQHFMATGMMYKEEQEEGQRLLKYVNSPSGFAGNSGLAVISKLLPLLTTGFLILVISGIIPLPVFFMLFLIQLGITGIFLKRINEMHDRVTKMLKSLKKYGKLLLIIQNSSFDSPLLKSIQRHLRSKGKPPSALIQNLSKTVEAFDNRLNFLAAILLNGLFLWDINCVIQLEQWNSKHRKQLSGWLKSITHMDALISFSVFCFNNPDFIFPVVIPEGKILEAVSLGHPLISRNNRICNDLSIDRGRLIIITGANMAGKSTFLRTTGIAMVFAMAGAPVCARKFHFRIMEVWSSMQTSDSLSRNESYFYAELKRLKHLIERIAEQKEVFVLLDEILKGTNTTDKQRGSVILLRRMLNMGSTGIIATHDLSLADLEKDYPRKIINKCFEVDIEEDRIHFDYLLRDGVTRKMNAMILMRQMGLITGEH